MVGKFARQVNLLILHEQTPLAQFYSLQATFCFARNEKAFCRSFESFLRNHRR